jgi:hypothetical protein
MTRYLAILNADSTPDALAALLVMLPILAALLVLIGAMVALSPGGAS